MDKCLEFITAYLRSLYPGYVDIRRRSLCVDARGQSALFESRLLPCAAAQFIRGCLQILRQPLVVPGLLPVLSRGEGSWEIMA